MSLKDNSFSQDSRKKERKWKVIFVAKKTFEANWKKEKKRWKEGKNVNLWIVRMLSFSLTLSSNTHSLTHTHSLSLALQLSKWWRLTTLNKFPLWKKPEVTSTRLLEGKNEDKLRLCREPLWKGTPFETKIQLCASARVGELMCKCVRMSFCVGTGVCT